MQQREKLQGIQLLRFLAAMFVVNYHFYAAVFRINENASYPSILSQGFVGVDIFFLISGYVIAMSVSNRTQNFKISSFFYKRFTRIYPTYWVVTLVILLGMLVFPDHINRSYDVDPSIIKSLLLLPHEGNPILNVGWSLEFEVWFYILIAASIMLFRSYYILGIVAMLVVSLFLYPTKNIFFDLIFSPYVFEFAFGVLIFKAERASTVAGRRIIQLGLYASPFLLFAFLTWHNVLPIGNSWDRILPSLAIALFFFGALRIAEPLFDLFDFRRFVYFLGDLSYAIYLTHVISLNLALIAFRRLELHHSEFVLIVGVNFVVLVGSVIFYKTVDQPIQNFLVKRK